MTNDTNTNPSASGDGSDWLPGIGWLDMDPERVELIKGLYRLAGWVAEHRDVPVAKVEAWVHPPHGATWDEQCAAVDGVAGALGEEVEDVPGEAYSVQAQFGPVKVISATYPAAAIEATTAALAYRDNLAAIQRAADGEGSGAVAAGVVADHLGHGTAADTVAAYDVAAVSSCDETPAALRPDLGMFRGIGEAAGTRADGEGDAIVAGGPR